MKILADFDKIGKKYGGGYNIYGFGLDKSLYKIVYKNYHQYISYVWADNTIIYKFGYQYLGKENNTKYNKGLKIESPFHRLRLFAVFLVLFFLHHTQV